MRSLRRAGCSLPTDHRASRSSPRGSSGWETEEAGQLQAWGTPTPNCTLPHAGLQLSATQSGQDLGSSELQARDQWGSVRGEMGQGT